MHEELTTLLSNIDRRLISMEERLTNIETTMATKDDLASGLDSLREDILNKIDWLAIQISRHDRDITYLQGAGS